MSHDCANTDFVKCDCEDRRRRERERLKEELRKEIKGESR